MENDVEAASAADRARLARQALMAAEAKTDVVPLASRTRVPVGLPQAGADRPVSPASGGAEIVHFPVPGTRPVRRGLQPAQGFQPVRGLGSVQGFQSARILQPTQDLRPARGLEFTQVPQSVQVSQPVQVSQSVRDLRSVAVSSGSEASPERWWGSGELAAIVAESLRPGACGCVLGSMSVLFALAAAVWQPGMWGAIAGFPEAGFLAAAQEGVPLERTVAVPDLGSQVLRVAAGLVDAYGIVLLGPVGIGPVDARRLDARVRRRRAVLLVAEPWPTAQVTVSVEGVAYAGIGYGEGVLGPARFTARVARRGGLWGEPEVSGLAMAAAARG